MDDEKPACGWMRAAASAWAVTASERPRVSLC
jgi:hypothetical protein